MDACSTIIKNKKNTTFWGTVGTMLLIIGGLSTLSLAAANASIYWFILTGLLVIIGVLLIAWAVGD